jgi:hypothetical protein
MLNDYCGYHKREVAALVGALDQGIVAELLIAKDTTPLTLLLPNLAQKLTNNLALATDAALWAVESWALALGLVLPNNYHPVTTPIPTPRDSVGIPPAVAAELTRYSLYLTFTQQGNRIWNYSIDLDPVQENNPREFFADNQGQEQQKFQKTLEQELGIQLTRTQIERLLSDWCKQIDLGYRDGQVDL